MVDEFSSFARMPTAVMAPEDLCEIAREAAFLQRVALPDISFDIEGMDQPVMVECDRRLIGQALTNLIKNAAEAIESRREAMGTPADDADDRIVVSIDDSGEMVSLSVSDTGIGLPRGERYRLLEPYVTRREKGTGLGLAIVKKIMEDHSGNLLLEDAPWVETGGHGASIRLVLPRTQTLDTEAAAQITDTDETDFEPDAAVPFGQRASGSD